MLIIIRGKPNSGKTSFANMLKGAGIVQHVFAADDYFEALAKELDSTYAEVFSTERLHSAHSQCQENVKAALERNEAVAVTNTFSKRWEMQPYLSMAAEYDVKLVALTTERHQLFTTSNDHETPDSVLERMHKRWQWLDQRGDRGSW